MMIIYRLLTLIICFYVAITPSLVFASTQNPTWQVTRSAPTWSNGVLRATYTFKNLASGLQRTAVGVLTRPEIGALARYVVSKRVAGFAALTASVGGLGYVVYDSNAIPNLYRTLPTTATALALPHTSNADQKPFTLVPSWTSSTAPHWCNYAVAFYNGSPDHANFRPYKIPDGLTNWCVWNSSNSALVIQLDDATNYRHTFYYGPSTVPLDDLRPVPPISIDTASGTTTAQDIANVSNTALGAHVSSLSTTSLAPLLDYTADYQSPAAARALAAAQAAYPADNITLDYPIDTPSKVGIPPTLVTDTTFDNATTYPTTTTGTGTGTGTGTATGDFALPTFCSWASSFCDWMDWTKQEPTFDEDTTVDVAEPDAVSASDYQRRYFEFSHLCPSPHLIPITFMGASQTLELSYEPLCVMADKMRPIIIMVAWIVGARIVTGSPAKGES